MHSLVSSTKILLRLNGHKSMRCFSISKESSGEDFTHFGYQQVPKGEKQSRVREVFENVAGNYDIMNDLMSGTLHRYWKNVFVNTLGTLSTPDAKEPARHLDVAGGTGDIAFRIANRHKLFVPGLEIPFNPSGNPLKMVEQRKQPRNPDLRVPLEIVVSDINKAMLGVGQERAIKKGLYEPGNSENFLSFVEANAEKLPFEDASFDSYTIAFGIRNCTNIDAVLAEAFRVLKPYGRFMCLEFSQVQQPLFRKFYNAYSFSVIPAMGQFVANDRESYQYLVESIQKFPVQKDFQKMVQEAGFKNSVYKNLTNGIVAIHSGFKLP